MSFERLFRWSGGALVEVDESGSAEYAIEVADSLLVRDGKAFALNLHFERFCNSVDQIDSVGSTWRPNEIAAFWTAAFGTIPHLGNWFPRIELQSTVAGTSLALRLREAPELKKTLTLLTSVGEDPRRAPAIKGPDLGVLGALRSAAQFHGADDAVIVTDAGQIIDCASNALVWWRGDVLCAPPLESEDKAFARVPSVTAKALFGLVSALGSQTRVERATPDDLAGLEVWALNALHGIRMVTSWIGGPKLTAEPGRIQVWRSRRQALETLIGGASN